MILMQELRRDVEGIQSPTPQPEDPGRSLDPASKEDPDIKVELIDGVFHQLSIDNALVAITADYPGLSPASQVSTTEVLTPLLFLMLIPDHRVPMVLRRRCLYGGKPSPRRLTNQGQCGPAGGRGVRRESKRRRKGMAHHCL